MFALMMIWLCVVLYLGVINVLTYAVWAMDKKYAIHGHPRVSERRLLGLCVLGGWPTAVISTYGLRHKCAKPSFLIKMYVAIALQLGGVAAMVHHMHEHPDALIELVRAANIPHSAFVCTFDAKAFCV